MIVTIDGPAGAGKSTTARALAKELGFAFLDTGAMYRALAWWLLRQGISLDDEPAAARAAASAVLSLEEGRISVNGTDVTSEIRTPEISAASSAVARLPSIRQLLVSQQRQIAAHGNHVCEGRDQGTVAFPDAIAKFFLTATAECRARRRLEDLRARGVNSTLSEQLDQQQERDHRDQTRASGPLVPADDAIVIDTTGMSIAEVVQRMKQIVIERTGQAVGGEVACG